MLNIIQKILRRLALKSLGKVKPRKIIVVAGSIGKTSTTQAVAHVLSNAGFRVCSTRHNYNTAIGVPSSILGLDLPAHAKNPFSWLGYFAQAVWAALRSKPGQYEYYVLELGTDHPGEIQQFAWLKPDIAICTAIAPEHMEYFKDLKSVATEELSVGSFSKKLLVNAKTVDSKYLGLVRRAKVFEYSRSMVAHLGVKTSQLKVVGGHSQDALGAAAWVAEHEALDAKIIRESLKSFVSPPGRMRKFKGIEDSLIIDDTYNSSPEAAIAALQYLYSLTSDNRVVLLGNMNELGESSAEEHTKLGEYCNKTKLALVVTLGKDANKYTAAAAKRNGCSVRRAETPKQAALFIDDQLREYQGKDSIVLAKGSESGVFAEETVKLLLEDSDERSELVRQSKRWQQKKRDLWVK